MITHKQETDAINNISNNIEISKNALFLGYTFDDSFKKFTILDTSNMSEWKKYIDKIYSISLAPVGKSSSLLIGVMAYSEFLGKYSVAYVKDSFLKRKIFSLSDDDTNFSTEWTIKEIFQQRLKRSGNIKSCIGDNYFGEGSIGSSMFVEELYECGMTSCRFETLQDICIDVLKRSSMIAIADKYIQCFEAASIKEKDQS
ncbi:hypothetical protein [Sulfurimonas sp.]